MRVPTPAPPRRRAPWLLACAAVATAAVPAHADDRDLLRFDSQKPYVFIILDTSGSMALAQDGTPVPGGMDDPNSRLFQAKRVIFDVVQEFKGIHLGFASLQQNNLRVVAKHWLYHPDPATLLPAAWTATLNYPLPTDMMVFGKHYPAGTAGYPTGSATASGALGSCDAPLAFNDANRATINRFSKLEVVDADNNGMIDTTDPNLETTLYVASGGGTYRITVARPLTVGASPNNNLGSDNVAINLTLQQVGGACVPSGDPVTASINLKINPQLPYGFIMNESAGPTARNGVLDDNNGSWNWRDVLQSYDCTGTPRSNTLGRGWEGNYDGPFAGPSGGRTLEALVDPYVQCTNRNDPTTCRSLKFPTTLSPPPQPGSNSVGELDTGDMMPLHWFDKHFDDILRRFAPASSGGVPAHGAVDFGAASYFRDLPDSSGYLPLRDASNPPKVIPMLAAGPTGFAAAVQDFKCWATADCDDQGNYLSGGWQQLAARYDPDWGCRNLNLILITDGNDNCSTTQPCADTAFIRNAGIRTWVLAFNGTTSCGTTDPARCIAANGGTGTPLCASTASQLGDELRSILGKIREQARTFTAAAVPSVQASVADKIFFASFLPAMNSSVWEGHLGAFLKPLPIDPTTRQPDTSVLCSSKPADQQSQCFLWDAAAQLVDQVPGSGSPLGIAAQQRRVFYGRQTAAGLWSQSRRLLQGTTGADGADQAMRYDLWRAFHVSFLPDNPNRDQSAQQSANAIVDKTLALKTHTFSDPLTGFSRTDTYLLGDVFHSDPLIVGEPQNTKFFAANVGANGGNCTADDTSTDTGYRCFAKRHANRRKLVIVGSNDGMLHAFDAGQAHAGGAPPAIQFDNGTGKEVFAYMPRNVMPIVKTLATGNGQQWTVDGPIAAADVFIAPRHGGTPAPGDRQWRTVAVGGLREGGRAVFALDLTQPDTLSPVGGSFLPAAQNGYVPSCLGDPQDTGNPAVSGCGPIPYPGVLWEFVDAAHNADGSTAMDASNTPVLLDEELNSNADLGFTWSTPNIGRIRIGVGGKPVEKYVAIFGGGMTPANAADKTAVNPSMGSWLYIVDIETGKAIYKRRLEGAVPSKPAAVDTNQEGLINRIYIGTTTGALYRVDLTANSLGHYPELQNVVVKGLNGASYTEKRVLNDPDSPTIAWEPRKIFNASTDNGRPSAVPRSIYYPPSVLFVARLGLYALAFGTGDREDLWTRDQQQGRFYIFVDDTELLPAGSLPLNESAFRALQVTSANDLTLPDFLSNGQPGRRGWYLVLAAQERTITPAFALSGIVSFSSYQPEICRGTVQPDGTCIPNRNNLCAKTGTSRIYITLAANGNAVLKGLAGTTDTKFLQVKTFVTAPYAEQAQTKNPRPGQPAPPGTNADQLTPQLTEVMNQLKKLFPRNCRFGNFRVDLKATSGDTGVIFIAPIPVCIIEKNWKDF